MDPDGWAVQTRVAWRRRGMQIRPTFPIHTVRHTAEFWRQSMPYRVTLGVPAAALPLTFLEPRLILTTLADVVAVYASGRLMSLDATYYGGNAAEGATVVTRLGLAIGLG